MSEAKTIASSALEAHEESIDHLHRKLAALPGIDQKRLSDAVAKYKNAHKVFHDDALGCVGF